MPAHTPGLAVSVSFSRSVPEMVGIDVFCGPDARPAIVPVFTDAWPVPSELRAVTTTSMRLPRSASLSVSERELARFVQLAICALQRTHW